MGIVKYTDGVCVFCFYMDSKLQWLQKTIDHCVNNPNTLQPGSTYCLQYHSDKKKVKLAPNYVCTDQQISSRGQKNPFLSLSLNLPQASTFKSPQLHYNNVC